jgi:superfamily II DNA or RNA helicase
MDIHGVTGSKEDGKLSPEQQKALDSRQSLCVRRVKEYWGKAKRNDPYPEVAMPTGFGKGRVVHSLIKSSKHDQILTVVGSKNILLDQSHDVLAGLAMDDTGEADFSILPDLSGRVVLATWQGLHSFSRKYTERPTFGLSVIDEVHNIGTASRLELLKWLKPEHAVGLTATAYRASGQFRAPEEYGFTVVDSMPLPECIDKRWLSPLMGICIDSGVMLPASVRKGFGELNQRKMSQALRRYPHLFENIATDIANRFLPSGMKTVIVVNRVNEEACVIAERLLQKGFKVGLAVNQYAAKQLSDRFVTLDAIRRYKLSHEHPDSIQVLISPQVIGEGFDAPATECVIWACPTMSHVRYTQVIGRGSRRCWMKKYCLVVDYVYMIENYGYSLNFAQFFKKEEMRELDGSFMYVGPEEIGRTIELPSRFSQGGKIVRVIDLQTSVYPEPGDWMSCEQICTALGRGQFWVEKRLNEGFLHVGEIRRLPKGKPAMHYPPDVKDKLLLQKGKKAGTWLTVTQIAALLQIHHKNVQTKLDKFLPGKGEQRLTVSGQLRVHYPPSIVKSLRKRWRKQDGPKSNGRPIARPSDGWLNLHQISLQVKKKRSWIQVRLRESDTRAAELHAAEQGQSRLYYPPSTLEYVKQKVAEEIPAGDWLTLPEIAGKLGRSETYVRARLGQDLINQSEMRKSRTNFVVCPHYPPSVLKKIKEKE